MPLTKKDGSKGLLATGKFGDACKKLEEYNVDGITDTRLLTALFRDYTFVASAYLLEPCDIFFRAKVRLVEGYQTLAATANANSLQDSNPA